MSEGGGDAWKKSLPDDGISLPLNLRKDKRPSDSFKIAPNFKINDGVSRFCRIFWWVMEKIEKRYNLKQGSSRNGWIDGDDRVKG